MNQVIKWALAAIAGVATFLVAGFAARFALQQLLLFMSSGESIEFQKSLASSSFVWIGSAVIALVMVPSAMQFAIKLINKHGVPGVLPAVETVIGEGKAILVVVRANGTDDKGNPARLELFTTKIKASSLAEFIHGPAGSKLTAHNGEGLYIVLFKARTSPYDDERQSDETYSIALRSEEEIFYRFETRWGEIARFVEKPESRVASCRYGLEFVGCERTEADASLLFQGEKSTMRDIFLTSPPASSAPEPKSDVRSNDAQALPVDAKDEQPPNY